jgi:hypothetical protein
MPNFIEIEGGLARIVTREVSREVPLASVLPFIENRPPVTLFHPRSAVATYWNESNPLDREVKFLCELAPGIRSIVKIDRRYRLAMPYTYFVFAFRSRTNGADANAADGSHYSMVDYFCFHAPRRFESLDDRVWAAFLPNVYEDGRICFGSTGVRTDQPLANRVDQLVNEWYQTRFNNDVQGGRQHPLPFNGQLPNGWINWVNETRDHGMGAIARMPEWDAPASTIPNWSFREVLLGQDVAGRGAHHVQISADRPRIATVTDEIPAIEAPWTFGRVAEWYANLTLTQRLRVLRAGQNYVEENPEALATVELETELEPTEDGGVPVEQGEF